MKQLMILSLFVILLASCSKNEINPIEQPDTVNTDETPTTPNNIIDILDDKLSGSNNGDKDALVPNIYFFLNAEEVENYIYDIHDPNRWITLIVKTEITSGKERLAYEFHAYDDQENFFQWGNDNGMFIAEAFDICQTLANNTENIRVRDDFLQTGVLSQDYINQMEQVYQNTLSQQVPIADILPTSTTLYKDFSNNLVGNLIPNYGTPIFSSTWNSNVSAMNGDNIYFPTILFKDDFFQNRMNPIIWNQSGKSINFTGPLLELNDKAKSWF